MEGDRAKEERRVGQVGESNGLTQRIGESDWPAKRIGAKNLVHEPKPPAIGFLYEDLAPSLKIPRKVFGQYPRTLIPALLPWLNCERHEILHVCSGSLPQGEGIRVDLRPDAHPDVIADGRALPFADGSQAAVMLDPPYTKHYARDLYGVDYARPSHLLREAARVVRPNGRIVFVHYITPNPPPSLSLRQGVRAVDGLRLPDARGQHLRAPAARLGRGA